MSRYTVFAGPPTARDLYSTWTEVHDNPPRTSRLRRLSTPPIPAHDVTMRGTTEIAGGEVTRERPGTDEPIDEAGVPSSPIISGQSMLMHPPTQRHGISQRQTQLSPAGTDSYADTHSYAESGSIQPNALAFFVHTILPLIEVDVSRTQPIDVLAYVAQLGDLRDVSTKRGDMARIEFELADASGGFLKITAWEQQAREIADSLRRCDIVYFRGIKVAVDPRTKATVGKLTANTELQVCYRVVRRSAADDEYRPDLRIGFHAPTIAVKALKDMVEREVLRM